MDSPLLISLEELPDEEALERARDEAQATLSQTGSRLARMKWPLLRDTAAGCMKSKLAEMDPLATLAGAWCTAGEILQLAAETKAAGSEKPYPLGRHNLSASVHPVVTLRCGPLTLPALTFTVTIAGLVECAILIIASGRLTQIEGLSVTPSAALSYGDKELKRLAGNPVTLGPPFVLPDGGMKILRDF
jgi:hypothetical protein